MYIQRILSSSDGACMELNHLGQDKRVARLKAGYAQCTWRRGEHSTQAPTQAYLWHAEALRSFKGVFSRRFETDRFARVAHRQQNLIAYLLPLPLLPPWISPEETSYAENVHGTSGGGS